MKTSNSIPAEHNAQLEFDFEAWPGERPTQLAVHSLAKTAGISRRQARTWLDANRPVGMCDD